MHASRHFAASAREQCSWKWLAGFVVLCLIGTIGCGQSNAATTAASSVTAEAPTSADSGTTASIELTDEGFAPDRMQILQGTRLMLRNSTDSKRSVVVKGRDAGGGAGINLTLDAGQTLDLNLHQLGAYVLTLADDPQVTASIFIS